MTDREFEKLIEKTLAEHGTEYFTLPDAPPHEFSPDFDNRRIVEYFNNGINSFFDVVDTWKDTIAGSTCLIIQNESDMNVVRERNPEWIASLEKYGINSKTITAATNIMKLSDMYGQLILLLKTQPRYVPLWKQQLIS